MSDFTLDTSGVVAAVNDPARCVWVHWPDLSPFEQGYVEALFASGVIASSALGVLRMVGGNMDEGRAKSGVGFRHLAPETLAAIRKDCAAVQKSSATPDLDEMAGRELWRLRQLGTFDRAGFPPLTVSLGDDGKVYARAAGL